MEVCEMTMRELIESINSTPDLKARFERYNEVLQDCSPSDGRAHGRVGRVGDDPGSVSEGEDSSVSDGIR
jgi:hypothetical protein